MGLLPPPAPLILLSDVPGTNQTVPCTLTPQSSTPVPSTRTPNWSLRLWETRRPCRREKVGPTPPRPTTAPQPRENEAKTLVHYFS